MPTADSGREIAVVGIGCRFPGAAGPSEFWEKLRAGTESVTFFTDEELSAAQLPRGLREDPDYVPAAAVLAGPDLFDAGFFGINPKEAAMMDPQHRIMLECAWEALEDSGVDPRIVPARTGVFAGSFDSGCCRAQPRLGGGCLCGATVLAAAAVNPLVGMPGAEQVVGDEQPAPARMLAGHLH